MLNIWNDFDPHILWILRRKHFYLLYTSIQIVLATLIFLLGVFPVKYPTAKNAVFQDLPTKVGNVSVDPHLLYKPRIDKVVIMIIDALRYDMVLLARSSLSNLHHWLERKEHCVIRARPVAPTVTMPRIKALMTGDPPGYIDTYFRTYEASKDSILYQAANRGLLSVFYGDETWLRVFPGLFNRTETTHSSFDTDFAEVDFNVTRNVERELLATDWSLMVLHYLGLDHIDDLFFPSSALIQPKLIEMDIVIGRIMDYVKERGNKSEKVILLVGGDHGKRHTGGHGATSLGEVIIPYILLNQDCDKNLRNEDLNEVDIAPMLSVLLGLPIPANNIGALDSQMLTTLTPYESLYAMHYNSKLLYAKYQKSFDTNSTIPLLGYNLSEAMAKAEETFEKAIGEDFKGKYHKQATFYYNNVQKFMSHALVKMGIAYNMPVLQFALVWIMLMFCNNLGCYNPEELINMPLRTHIFLGPMIIFALDPLGLFNPLRISTIFVIICYGLVMWNMYKFSPHRWLLRVRYQSDQILFYFCLASHALLNLSTSSLEEEHTFWYFLFSSYLVYLYLSERKTSMLFLMLYHSICQYFNSAGDKYPDKYDLGDLLNSPDQSSLLFTVYIIGLFFVCYLYEAKIIRKTWYLPSRYESLFRFSYNATFTAAFLLQLRSGRIFPPFVSKSYRFYDWLSPFYLWALLIAGTTATFIILLASLRNYLHESVKFLVVYFLEECSYHEDAKPVDLNSDKDFILEFCCYSCNLSKSSFQDRPIYMNVCIFVCCITYSAICPPHNILLLATIICYLSVFRDHCRNNMITLGLLHVVLAMVGFYYQGNSVDVAVGYRTLFNLNNFISSPVVYLYTFCIPIISILYLFRSIFIHMLDVSQLHNSIEALTTVSMAYMLHICTQTYFVQRHHLFVWSVAPKLLYTSALIATINLLIIFILLVYMYEAVLFRNCFWFFNNILE